MADLTTNLDLISQSQAQKEATADALFDAGSPSSFWGRRASQCAALTWGYYGGVLNGLKIPNGAILLANNATCYIRLATTGTGAGTIDYVTSAPSGWPNTAPDGDLALYQVTTASGLVTNWLDWRQGVGLPGPTGATGASGANGTNGTNWAATTNAQTGTGYSLQSSDNGVIVTLSNASGITLTVPSGLGANFACELIQIGAGQVTIVASGVTISSYGGFMKIAGQYATANLFAYASDVFSLAGTLSA